MTDIPVSMNRNQVTGKLQSGAAFPESLKFPAGYFEPAVMPMVVVRPTTNSDAIGTYSCDHNGYVGRETQIRITIQGGAYPYAPILESAPSGATLGADVFSSDYMVLKYTPASLGLYDFRVKVFDQEGTSVTISWTLNVNTGWCVFVSPTGNDITGDGSRGSPYATITKAWSVTTGGKALILEDGTYTDLNGSKSLITSEINSLLAFNQKQVVIDCASWSNTSSARVFNGNSSNMLAQGIIFRNPPNVADNPRWFSFNSICNNLYQDNCEFQNNHRLGSGANGDNPSCFFLGGSGSSQRIRIAQTRCVFDALDQAGNGWSAIDTYAVKHVVIEDNVLTNQGTTNTGDGVIWLKGAYVSYVDVRNNNFVGTWNSGLIEVRLGAAENSTSGMIDISYNQIKAGSTIGGIWIGKASQDFIRLPAWSRRNTVIDGGIMVFARSWSTTFNSSSDILQTSITTSDPFKVCVRDSNLGQFREMSFMPELTYSVTNYECHQASGVVDINRRLIGTYRTNYLGKRGHTLYNPSTGQIKE